MKSELIFCVIIVLLAVTPAKGTILITEVFYDTPGTDSDEEWIELYNPTSIDLSVGNYTIEDNADTYTIGSGTDISAGQVLVFARDSTEFEKRYGFYPDFGDFSRGLNNNGDFLILKDSSDNELDMVAWEGEVTGWNIEASTGESIRRISLGSGPNVWKVNQDPDPGSPAPIPEPSTLILLGSGLIGLVGILYRRKRQREAD